MKPKLVKNSNPPEKHFGKYRNRTTRVCGYVISIGGTDNNNAWLRLLVGKRTKRILLSTLAKWDFIEEPTLVRISKGKTLVQLSDEGKL